jgi:hypothetical protein
LNQQKKFFQALERAGGLFASARGVCNSDTSAFGLPGSALRRQFRNRVNLYRNHRTTLEYFEFLNSIGVTPNTELNRAVRTSETSDGESDTSSFSSPACRLPRSTPRKANPRSTRGREITPPSVPSSLDVDVVTNLFGGLSMATTRFDIESDPSVDDETKDRVRRK